MLDLATGWLLFGSLIAAWGAIAGRFLIQPRVRDPILEGTASRMGAAAGVALLVALGLVLFRQLVEFRDPFVPWREDAELLVLRTPWGATWRIAMGAALALPVAFLFAGRDVGPGSSTRVAWGVAALLTAGLGTFPTFTGHAAGTEGIRWAAMPADALHVAAAGVWVGGLAFVLLSEAAWRRQGRVGSLLPRTVPAFSPLAMLSVAALFATGTFAAWLHMERLDELWTTDYGRLISFKLVLVFGVMALGAVNWRRHTPRLHESGGPEALRRAATVELLIAQLVVLVTAVLVRTAPFHDWFWDTSAH